MCIISAPPPITANYHIQEMYYAILAELQPVLNNTPKQISQHENMYTYSYHCQLVY
jgi:hypothetical protein